MQGIVQIVCYRQVSVLASIPSIGNSQYSFHRNNENLSQTFLKDRLRFHRFYSIYISHKKLVCNHLLFNSRKVTENSHIMKNLFRRNALLKLFQNTKYLQNTVLLEHKPRKIHISFHFITDLFKRKGKQRGIL